MKSNISISISVLFFTLNMFSQQIENGFAPSITDFSVQMGSGAYNAYKPIGTIPDLSYQGGWQHLMVVRHPNPTNNFQLQIASSMSDNDKLYFRKLASPSATSANSNWNELATRGSNSFIGSQSISGNLTIGNDSEIATISGPTNGGAIQFKDNAGNGGSLNRFLRIGWKDNNAIFKSVISINDDLNVGIGTTTPAVKLDVFGTISSYEPSALGSTINSFQLIGQKSGNVGENTIINRLWTYRDGNLNNWYTSRLHDGISIDSSFNTPNVDTKTWWERDPQDNIQSWGNNSETYLTINKGNVGIGITNPTNKLDVNGTIHSKEVKVDMNDWSDFVFKKDYVLPTLEEVEIHITEKGHLENIPSEKEVLRNGINLGEMNAKLLQKIEEMTLYMIEQNKQIIDLKNRLEKVEIISK